MIFFSPFDGSLSSITDLQKDPSMIVDDDHMMMMMMRMIRIMMMTMMIVMMMIRRWVVSRSRVGTSFLTSADRCGTPCT